MVIKNQIHQSNFIIYFTKVHLNFLRFEQWKKQTLCVSYFYCAVLLYIWSLKSDLSRNSVLAILIRFVGFFTNLPVNKADTMCLGVYCFDLRYFWSLKIDLIRNTLLDISLRFVWDVSQLDQWKKKTLCVSQVTMLIVGTFVHYRVT